MRSIPWRMQIQEKNYDSDSAWSIPDPVTYCLLGGITLKRHAAIRHLYVLRTKAFDLKGKGMLGAKKAGSHQSIHVGHSVSFLGLCMAQPDMRGRAYWVSPAG